MVIVVVTPRTRRVREAVRRSRFCGNCGRMCRLQGLWRQAGGVQISEMFCGGHWQEAAACTSNLMLLLAAFAKVLHKTLVMICLSHNCLHRATPAYSINVTVLSI